MERISRLVSLAVCLLAAFMGVKAEANDRVLRTFEQPLVINIETTDEKFRLFSHAINTILYDVSQKEPNLNYPTTLYFLSKPNSLVDGQINVGVFPKEIDQTEKDFFSSLVSESDQCFVQSLILNDKGREVLLAVSNPDASGPMTTRKCYLLALAVYSGNFEETLGGVGAGEMGIGSMIGFITEQFEEKNDG